MTTSTTILERKHASATNTHNEEPSAALVVGILQERVDPYMLQVIDHLFPGHHGLGFLAKLLRLAQTKQMALPDLGLPQVTDVAVISVKSLREMAKTIGVSYDTTEKYVVVLCSLGLLWKQRDQQQITLHFPLSRPQLPGLETLDKLKEYRPKVQTFASQVKKRLLLLGKSEEAYVSTKSSRSFFGNDEPRLLLEDICRILQEEVDSASGKRILFKIERVIEYRCTQGSNRLFESKVDSDDNDDANLKQTHKEKSPFQSQKADFKVADLDQESLLSSQKGDFSEDGDADLGQTHAAKSPFQNQKVDSDLTASHGQSLLSAQKGDFLSQSATSKRRLLDKNEDSASQKGDFSDQKVDFEASSLFPNVNVLEYILQINVNVKPIIKLLGTIFGDPLGKHGYYYQLHKKYQNPEAWLAAVVETIVAIHRPGSDVKNPGKYFYSRCIACHENISSETAQLVSQYRSLSYPQLLEALQEAPSSKTVQKLPDIQRDSVSTQKITLCIPRLPKWQQGMSHHSIKELVTLIKTGAQTKNMRYQPYLQDDGSGILLVEDWVGHQRWIRSLEEWQTVAHTVRQSVWPPKKTNGENTYKGAN